mgnify:CR=1 FL=1
MPPHPTTDLPVALSIAGSDSGAGAGIQADLLTFAANGVYGTTALTCLTAQNPLGVSGVQAATPAFVVVQCRQVTAHYRPKALKTGMLLNVEIVRAVAAFIATARADRSRRVDGQLARELAPRVRVNGVAPGPIMWPESSAPMDAALQERILDRTALKRTGSPADIAKAVLFFLKDAPYVTGQILAVDGGRTVGGY